MLYIICLSIGKLFTNVWLLWQPIVYTIALNIQWIGTNLIVGVIIVQTVIVENTRTLHAIRKSVSRD